jgi:hypothetical protein
VSGVDLTINCNVATCWRMMMEFGVTAHPTSNRTEPGSVRDSFSIWPAAITIAGPVGLIFLWSCPFDVVFMGAPMLLVIWGLAAIVALAVAIESAVQHAWKRAMSAVVLPLAVLAALLNLNAVWMHAIEAGEQIHFRVMRASYLAQVAKLPTDNGPRLAIFRWGGFVISHAVVYDESDEIVLSAAQQSAAWKARIAGTELECGVWGSPVGDHFYLVRMGC